MSAVMKEVESPTVELNQPAKRIATTAIEAVHSAYYEKGGIRDSMSAMQEQVDSAAKHVYSIAVFAVKQHSDDAAAAVDLYMGMCTYAETGYKKAHNVENLRDALPTWASFKSSVLRGLRLGLNPTEFKSEKRFRNAVQEKIVAERPRLAAAPEPEPLVVLPAVREAELLNEQEIVELVSSTTVPDSLKTLLSQVVFACEVIKTGAIGQAEDILRETWQRLNGLTDKRKTR